MRDKTQEISLFFSGACRSEMTPSSWDLIGDRNGQLGPWVSPPTQTFLGVRHAFLSHVGEEWLRDEPVRTSAWEPGYPWVEWGWTIWPRFFNPHRPLWHNGYELLVLKTKSSLAFHPNERFLLNQPPEQVLRPVARIFFFFFFLGGGGGWGRGGWKCDPATETDQTSPEAKVPALEGEGRGY